MVAAAQAPEKGYGTTPWAGLSHFSVLTRRQRALCMALEQNRNFFQD